jgi:hypothetical protein
MISGTPDTQMAHSVTLLVTPKQAELIDLAGANGHARMVLRGLLDRRVDDLAPIAMSELTGRRAPDSASAPARSGDPFAGTASATTEPSPSNQWRVRVIAAGDSSIVSLRNSPSPAQQQPAVTGTDSRNVGAP